MKNLVSSSYYLQRPIYAGQYIYWSIAPKSQSYPPAGAASPQINRNLGASTQPMSGRINECGRLTIASRIFCRCCRITCRDPCLLANLLTDSLHLNHNLFPPAWAASAIDRNLSSPVRRMQKRAEERCLWWLRQASFFLLSLFFPLDLNPDYWRSSYFMSVLSAVYCTYINVDTEVPVMRYLLALYLWSEIMYSKDKLTLIWLRLPPFPHLSIIIKLQT